MYNVICQRLKIYSPYHDPKLANLVKKDSDLNYHYHSYFTIYIYSIDIQVCLLSIIISGGASIDGAMVSSEHYLLVSFGQGGSVLSSHL